MPKYNPSTSIEVPLAVKHNIYEACRGRVSVTIADLVRELDFEVAVIEQAVQELDMTSKGDGVYEADPDYEYSHTDVVITNVEPTRTYKSKWTGETIDSEEVFISAYRDGTQGIVRFRVGDEVTKYSGEFTAYPSFEEVHHNLPESIFIVGHERISNERMECIVEPEMPSESDVRRVIAMEKDIPTYNDFTSFSYPDDTDTFHQAFVSWLANRKLVTDEGELVDIDESDEIMLSYYEGERTADEVHEQLKEIHSEALEKHVSGNLLDEALDSSL